MFDSDVRSVDQFLRLSRDRGGDDHRVNCLEVRFCFTIDYASEMNRWVDFAGRELRMEDLRICMVCRGSYYRGDGIRLIVFNSNSLCRITSLFGHGLDTLYLTSCQLGHDLLSGFSSSSSEVIGLDSCPFGGL